MAYGTIYQFEYRDINDILTVVRIKQDGYAGSVTTRESVNAGCEFSWGDSSNDLPIVYGSEVNVFVDAESDYEFLFLFSASSRKHLVEIDKGGALFWKGFIEPDSWSEPLIAAPYPVQFTAYDMMGFLDQLDFVDANGDPFEGRKTMIELIQMVLEQTTLGLPVHTATDFEEFAQAASTDYFALHSVNLEIFAGLSYLEVLKQVLVGHSIRQRDGKWWIISNSIKAAAGTINYYIYPAGSGTSSGTASTSLEDSGDWWIEDEADMELLPALRQLSITQDYGYQDNLLKNGNFKRYTVGGLLGKLSALNYWTANNADLYISRIDDSRVALQIGGREEPPNPPAYNPQWQTEGITHDGLMLEPGNGSAKLTFKYGLMCANPGVSSYMFFRITHTVGATIYYLRQFGNSTTREMDYEWTTNGDDIRTAITLNSHYTSNYTGGAFKGARVNPDQVEGELYYEINDKLKTFTANIPQVPDAGNMQITLWKPFTPNPDVMGAVYAELGIEVLNAEEESYVASETLTVINNLENNHVPSDLKLAIGNIPDISNNETIYWGALLRADGTAATGFRIGASAWYSWGELAGRLTASMKRSPRRSYNGNFADLTPRMNLIIADKQNPTLKLIETGITYNDHMATVSGRYVQLLPLSLVAGQVADYVVRRNQGAEKQSVSSGSGSGTGTGSTPSIPTTVDNDEKVVIIGEEGEKLSAAGYLDDVYFEGIANETNGKTYMKPKDRLLHRNPTAAHTAPIATGDNAIAIGEGTTADIMRQITLGCFNAAIAGSADTWAAIDPLLVVGNGADNANRSNAAVLYKSGYTQLNNGLRLGAFSWGANNPEEGVLSFDSVNGHRAYHSSAWLKLGVKVDALNFNAGSLTLKQNRGLSDLSVNLDSRYYTKDEIDDIVAEVIYTPASITTNVGSYVSGNLASVSNLGDDNFYQVDEVTGVPGFNIEATFSGINSVNRIWLHLNYEGSTSHVVRVELYNYSTLSWDLFTTFTTSTDYQFLDIPVTNNVNYISSGNARLRIYHNTSGNPSHDIKIDYIAIAQAGQGSSNEHGALMGLLDDDHPQYLTEGRGDVRYLQNETDPIYTASSWYTTVNNSTNWNTAYAYSQVGHLPLTGGTLSGAISWNDGKPLLAVSVSDGTYLGSNTRDNLTLASINTPRYRNQSGNYFNIYHAGNFIDNSGNWNTAYSWGNHASAGYLLSSSYTAADVLAKIKTVDGVGSGLDADLLDGQHLSNIWRKDEAGSTSYNWSANTMNALSYQVNGTTVIDASRNVTGVYGTFSNIITALKFKSYDTTHTAGTPFGAIPGGGGDIATVTVLRNNGYSGSFLKFDKANVANNNSKAWIGAVYNSSFSSDLYFYSARKGNVAYGDNSAALNLKLSQDLISFYSSTGSNSPTLLANLNGSGLDLRSGSYQVNGTTVIDASRNVTGATGTFSGSLTVQNGNPVRSENSNGYYAQCFEHGSANYAALRFYSPIPTPQPFYFQQYWNGGGRDVIYVDITGSVTFSGNILATGDVNTSGLFKKDGNTIYTSLLTYGSTGSSGQVLMSNGATSSPVWATFTASAGGSSGQIQYNNGGVLGGFGTISTYSISLGKPLGLENRALHPSASWQGTITYDYTEDRAYIRRYGTYDVPLDNNYTQSLTPAATVLMDWRKGAHGELLGLGQNTILQFTDVPDGAGGTVLVLQDGSMSTLTVSHASLLVITIGSVTSINPNANKYSLVKYRRYGNKLIIRYERQN